MNAQATKSTKYKVSVKSVPDVLTQGRSIEQARKRIREALSLSSKITGALRDQMSVRAVAHLLGVPPARVHQLEQSEAR